MTPPTRRGISVRPALVPVLAVLAGVIASAIAASSTGAMAPLVFVEDAGPLVRWSVPLVRVMHDVAAAMTFAALVFAASLVPDDVVPAGTGTGSGAPANRGGGGPDRALRVAALAGLAWAVSAIVGVVLSFADAAGLPLSSRALAQQFGALAWELDITRIGIISAACAVVVATAAVLARTRATAAWLATVAGLGIVVLGLASHTGTSDEHETSVNAIGLHLIGAMMWVGGLLTLVVLHRSIARNLAVVATRYSTLALLSFITVGASGILATTTRLGTWSDLGTAYGLLIVVKGCAFVVLGVAGWWHRRSTIADLDAGISGRPFFRLAVGEALVMGATFGVATALSRSAPPEPESFPDPTPTLAITGFPAPPAPILASLWSTWRVDWLFLAVAVVAVVTYAAGLVGARVAAARSLVALHSSAEHEHARGEPANGSGASPSVASAREAARLLDRPWPAWRAVSWMLGCVVLGWATSGAVGVYARVSVSWHVALLVVLALVVAPLLVLGAPAGLARRALSQRDDGTLGPREVLLGITDSAALRVLRRPWVATTLLVGGVIVLHGTGLLDLALTTHPGHLVMVVATLAVGALWASAILGAAEPGGPLPLEALSCLLAVVAAGFVAALWLSRGTSLLAGDIYQRMALGWQNDLVADQARAGAVVLFVTVPVCVAMAVGLLVRTRPPGSARSDTRRS